MKLTQKQALNILEDFQAELELQGWYKSIKPHIKATLLYGSVAKGNNKPNSDIDVLLILPLKFEEQYTNGEYFYNFKDVEINIVLRSIEKLRKIAAGAPDEFQQEVFRDSVLIYESDNEVSSLLKQISNPGP